jgi:fructose-bisphosphate aldolase class II
MKYTLDMAEAGTPLDSIMIDCSHSDSLDENIALTRKYVSRAVSLGLATEAELGRLEGGEAGIATAVDSQLTDPEVADRFIEETGIQILAPCIGNRHGHYVQPPDFRRVLVECAWKIG